MSAENPKLKYLDDVPWDNSLRLSNGKVVHGLEQLPMIIKFSDDEVFQEHVNSQKNDLAKWIRDVIGDAELADKLLPILNKDEFLKFMDQAIIDIRNYKTPEQPPQPALLIPVQPAVQMPLQSVFQPIAQPVPAPVIPQPVQQPQIIPITQTVPIPVAPLPVQQSVFQPIAQPVSVPVISQPVSQSTLVTQSSPITELKSDVKSDVKLDVKLDVKSDIKPNPVPEQISQQLSSQPASQVPAESTAIPVSPQVPSLASTLTSISNPASATVLASNPTPVADEIYDFEEIFKLLLEELELETFAWENSQV